MNTHFTLPENSCSNAFSANVVTEDQSVVEDVVVRHAMLGVI